MENSKTPRLFIDQYGNRFYASTIKELKQNLIGAVSKMYVDRKGESFHIGYVIGQHWLTEYAAVERKA